MINKELTDKCYFKINFKIDSKNMSVKKYCKLDL